jgi:GNAT superfamily N-acetyltransferase
MIRRAAAPDYAAVLALVPRLTAFGPPAWRDSPSMTVTDLKVIEAALRATGENPQVLVAVSESDEVMGFVHVRSAIDYYTEREHGHVADIVVAERHEGRGVGRSLLSAAEQWTRDQGYDWLTIGVFPQNTRPLRMYEQFGFERDIAHLLKRLR